jgi:hypothetical protein
MRDVADRILSQKRKSWFRSRPLFEPHRTVSESDLAQVEGQVNAKLPADLKTWLLAIGYGDIDGDLSFRAAWFKNVDRGEAKGAVIFAQDTLGNFYAYKPQDEHILLFSRSSPEYAVLAPSFRAFMEELERRDFKVLDWVESVALLPYDWGA